MSTGEVEVKITPTTAVNTKRLETQIQDILEAVHATEAFIAGMDFVEFSADQKTIFAVERSLGIMGATSKRLPISFLDKYPAMNWRRIIGIGESLTFGYLEVDLQTLWEITQQDLPTLKKLIETVLEEISTAS
ncbi:HepT-like ribonuclease domain-containing protein [Tumidithrix elongata RA019]|uniref:HepT-like ribonuclease domain-containing protein n=1 Tax=Tumidithrix elongata BACA0141 TaxID=2716417 RepID=A0AAW9Q111_9CYAN|nr:HepT-like ribonuclease domain-containing protein [Tumidithrix elongata RA019]